MNRSTYKKDMARIAAITKIIDPYNLEVVIDRAEHLRVHNYYRDRCSTQEATEDLDFWLEQETKLNGRT